MANFRFQEQKATSLRHKIADDIREAILEGKLKPKDRLREVEISQQMGVSRGPVREAMRMLEQEGLLYSHPYKETMVAEISREEVLEVLIPIRLTIEQFAIRKGLSQLEPSDFDYLQKLVDEMKLSAEQKNLEAIVKADLAFHEYLISFVGMNNLTNIWSSIYNRIRLHFLMQGHIYESFDTLAEAHEQLLQTIRSKNIGEIAEQLRLHIYETNLPYMERFSSEPSQD